MIKCSLGNSHSPLIELGLLDHTPYLGKDNGSKEARCDNGRYKLLLEDANTSFKVDISIAIRLHRNFQCRTKSQGRLNKAAFCDLYFLTCCRIVNPHLVPVSSKCLTNLFGNSRNLRGVAIKSLFSRKCTHSNKNLFTTIECTPLTNLSLAKDIFAIY